MGKGRQPECAASTHRNAGEVDAVGIDGKAALDVRQHVVNVALGDPAIAAALDTWRRSQTDAVADSPESR